ncbi:hypothetical protein [Arthrobacter sp. PAMC 25486]|uniref:hypothetical protein n=1 Tax=Arthrobacter sp. PAMC 25486 TaxID=1494608 RepID=UPI0012FE9DE0|nr:hypothetical protein [Arthrobacter sp. PAMC 25486]
MAVVWPDIEALLISAAKPLFAARTEPYAAGVHVSNKMPTLPNGTPIRKDRMVIIRDDSGNQLDVVRDLVRVGVQFWGPTREDAKDLAELGRALFNSMAGTGPIKKIKCTLRPVFVEDAQPFFYATFELIVKGRNL